MMILV